MGSKRDKILGKVVGAVSDLEKASSSKRILDSIRENPQNEKFTDDDFQLAIKRGEFEGVLKKLKSGNYRLAELGGENKYDPEHGKDSRRGRKGSRRRGKSRKRSRSRSGHRRSSSRRRKTSSSRRRRR